MEGLILLVDSSKLTGGADTLSDRAIKVARIITALEEKGHYGSIKINFAKDAKNVKIEQHINI